MRGVLALSYLKVSLYIRVISRNVEILSLALIIPRLILGTSVLFKSYMSVAGDNPDLNKFIVSLRGRMLKYDLRSLYLYLAIFMAINGGILLSEDDLLAALIL